MEQQKSAAMMLLLLPQIPDDNSSTSWTPLLLQPLYCQLLWSEHSEMFHFIHRWCIPFLLQCLKCTWQQQHCRLEEFIPPPSPPHSSCREEDEAPLQQWHRPTLSQIASSLPLPVISFAVSDILKPTRLGRTAGKFLMYRRVTLSFNGISLQDFLPLLCHRLILWLLNV